MSTETQWQPTHMERIREFISEDNKAGWDKAWSVIFLYRDGRTLMNIAHIYVGKQGLLLGMSAKSSQRFTTC